MTPPVTIIITTYDNGSGQRTALAVQTIRALQQYLLYPDLRWLIADDGSPQTHIDTLRSVVPEAQFTNAARGGVGKSKNLALQEAFKVSPFVLLMEDDWVLKGPLDLAPHVGILERHPDLGMVRMGYLGGTIIADFDGDSLYSFWRLRRGSGVYIYSGQVSLRHERFYNATGWHPEGNSAGEEELAMCIRFNATENCPDIIWPARFGCELNTGPFINVGMSASVNAVVPA